MSHGFETLLFEDVALSLYGGTSCAIVGRSGCGKSTLLHILASFIKPNAGSVELLSQELYSLKEREIEALRRYEIGIIFQFHYLFKGMSGLANIEVATMLSGETIDNSLLRSLEIESLVSQKIGELSGGQQQRVSIARVLSKKPKIIFADEPTGNLDNETASLVMEVLLAYVKENEATLLLVTHDEKMALQCDTTYKLEQNQLKQVVL